MTNNLVHFVELGQRVTDAFNKIEDEIGQFNWYLFPEEMKQMLRLVMIMTQQPVIIECFGSISCSRETFKKVIYHLIFSKLHIELEFACLPVFTDLFY